MAAREGGRRGWREPAAAGAPAGTPCSPTSTPPGWGDVEVVGGEASPPPPHSPAALTWSLNELSASPPPPPRPLTPLAQPPPLEAERSAARRSAALAHQAALAAQIADNAARRAAVKAVAQAAAQAEEVAWEAKAAARAEKEREEAEGVGRAPVVGVPLWLEPPAVTPPRPSRRPLESASPTAMVATTSTPSSLGSASDHSATPLARLPTRCTVCGHCAAAAPPPLPCPYPPPSLPFDASYLAATMDATRADAAAARAAAERAASAAVAAVAAVRAVRGAPTPSPFPGPPLPRLRTRTALLFPPSRPPTRSGDAVCGRAQIPGPGTLPSTTTTTPTVAGQLEAMDGFLSEPERNALWGGLCARGRE